jgi:hypothetical protein
VKNVRVLFVVQLVLNVTQMNADYQNLKSDSVFQELSILLILQYTEDPLGPNRLQKNISRVIHEHTRELIIQTKPK